MKDYAQISLIDAPPAFEAEFIALGFDRFYSKSHIFPLNRYVYVVRLDVPADDSRLAKILSLAESYDADVQYYTQFDKKDIECAHWFELQVISWLGYPKPESSWASVVFDMKDPTYCLKCGIGHKQTAPFRVSSSHRAGKTASIFRLGWVNDEVFVRAQVRDEMSRAKLTGIEFGAVIKAGSKEPFDDLHQVIIRETLAIDAILTKELHSKQCNACGRVKFNYSNLALNVASESLVNAPDIVKSAEWFGDGAAANRLVLVSRRFQKLITAQKWKQVRLRPIILQSQNQNE